MSITISIKFGIEILRFLKIDIVTYTLTVREGSLIVIVEIYPGESLYSIRIRNIQLTLFLLYSLLATILYLSPNPHNTWNTMHLSFVVKDYTSTSHSVFLHWFQSCKIWRKINIIIRFEKQLEYFYRRFVFKLWLCKTIAWMPIVFR